MRWLVAVLALVVAVEAQASSITVSPAGTNAATATALAANPADCSANQYATTIAASGALTCATVTHEQVTGQVITVTDTLFASLGTPADGILKWCSDCKPATAATCTGAALSNCVCAGSGTGAFAKRIASTWYCGVL